MESYWPLVKQIADRALLNPESAKSQWNKKDCILMFAKMIHAVWAERGYIDWLANRKPWITWLLWLRQVVMISL